VIQQLAKKISSYMINKSVICLEEKDIYDYSFELFLATLLNIAMIAVLAIISDRVLEAGLFLTSFAVLRMFGGGYHANSHFACALILAVNYLIFILFLSILPNSLFVLVSVAGACTSSIVIFLLSPVVNKNKPMSKEEKCKNKKISRYIVFFTFALSLILTGFFPCKTFSLSISFGMISVSISQLSAIFRKIIIARKHTLEVTKC